MFKNLFGLVLIASVLLISCVEQGQNQPPEPIEATAFTQIEPEPTDLPTSQPELEAQLQPTPEPITNNVGPIRIGFMGPLTGGASFLGNEQVGFVKSVVTVFSEQTGLQIEIVEADTEINPETGIVAANRFVNDSTIIGVVGPSGSQVCEATQPIFEGSGLAHITPSCTKTDLTIPGTNTFFRPIPTDADQSRSLAAHMIAATRIRSLFIIDDKSSYASVLSDELELLLIDSGIRIRRFSITQDTTDFSSIAAAIIDADSDAVFAVTQTDSQTSAIAMELDKQGYTGHYYLPDTGFVLNWVRSAGAAAEGAYVSFFAPDPNLVPEAAQYNSVYRDNFGPDFGALGGAAGLATQILLMAVDQCARNDDVSRVCVVEELRFIEMNNTMLGIPIKFGEGNQSEGGFSIFQIQNGEFQLLSGVGDPGIVVE